MTEAPALSVGVFTTDNALVVRSWDAWMAQSTGLHEAEVVGRALDELFPDIEARGLLARMRRVTQGKGVEVFAPAFHKYLIPCRPRERGSRFEHMRQHVTVSPIRDDGGIHGILVTIQDVTARLDMERELAIELASADEEVRLRAAEKLAERDASPSTLVDALADGSWRVRRAAAHAMAKTSAPEAIATLVEVVRERHQDPAMLNAALSALAESDKPSAVFAVAALLDSEDPNVRIYAALALGMLGDERALPALLSRLADPDLNVRYHAIEALGRIGDRRSASVIADIAETRDFFLSFAALEALAIIGDPSVAGRLVPLLEDPMLVPAIAAALGALASDDAAVPLVKAITKPNAPAAVIAVALWHIHDRLEAQMGEGALVADLTRAAATPDTVTALLRAMPQASVSDLSGIATVLGWLEDSRIDSALAPLLAREGVAETAAVALSRRGAPAAAAIIKFTAEADDSVLRVAAAALGRIGSPAAVPFLVSLLPRGAEVAVPAASALAGIGDRRAFEPLLDLLEHRDPSVRHAAVAALNSIGDRGMEQEVRWRLSNERPWVREAAARIAGYFGYPTCLDLMIRCCVDSDESVRRAAVEHLSSYNDSIAWEAIRATLIGDTSHAVRAAAARALGRSADEASIDALVGATSDPNLWVRYYSIRSLGERKVASEAVAQRLVAAARGDEAPPVRIAALRALTELAVPAAVPVLEETAGDPEVDIAVAAIEGLGRFEAAPSVPVLLRALESREPRRMVAALGALAERGAATEIPRIAGIAETSSHSYVSQAAVAALARLSTSDAIDALAKLASARRLRPLVIDAIAAMPETALPFLDGGLASEDEQVRAALVDALTRMKRPGAARLIARLLEDPSPMVRRLASHALARV
ncbi:MAG TPA: HEAT repeat domain-containing protein [Gemmatimonadaceae bacterium]|nr:HEAT repeat domain-containing protein [Gemmatimonadaceae bacterium]